VSSLTSTGGERGSLCARVFCAVSCLLSLSSCSERVPSRSESGSRQARSPYKSASLKNLSGVEPIRLDDCSTDEAWARIVLRQVVCMRTSTSDDGDAGYSVCKRHGQLYAAPIAIRDEVIRLYPHVAQQVRDRGSQWVRVSRTRGVDLEFCAEVGELWHHEGRVVAASLTLVPDTLKVHSIREAWMVGDAPDNCLKLVGGRVERCRE